MKFASWGIAIMFIVIASSSCSRQTEPDYVSLSDETPQATYPIDSLTHVSEASRNWLLDLLVKLIESGSFGNIHSLIIIQDDQVIVEKYFNGWTRHILHPIYSATKSVVSALIGIAIDQGVIENVDINILTFFPEYENLENYDERKERITLQHLLSNTAGFLWDEFSTPYFDSRGNYNPQNIAVQCLLSDDPLRFLLDLPMSAEPGTEFVYNSGCSNMIAAILTKATGQTPPEFAKDNLFNPLGITEWQWKTQSNGIIDNATSFYIHPANFAMFAHMFLKNGKTQGEQIISENWVQESTSKHAQTVVDDVNWECGYQWWHMSDTGLASTNGMYYASGVYGQMAFIIPNLDLVVVTTAGTGESYMDKAFGLLMGFIVPAVSDWLL